jgi:hypothetical protein
MARFLIVLLLLLLLLIVIDSGVFDHEQEQEHD